MQRTHSTARAARLDVLKRGLTNRITSEVATYQCTQEAAEWYPPAIAAVFRSDFVWAGSLFHRSTARTLISELETHANEMSSYGSFLL